MHFKPVFRKPINLLSNICAFFSRPYFKLTTYEGGTQTPLIISGRPVRKRGIVTRELLHVTDLLPTLLDFARVGYRATAEDPCPLYGVSLKPFLQEETFQPVRNPFNALCFEIVECKAVLKGGWKLIFMAPPYGSGESWRLYNLDEDIKEEIDLSDRYPEKVDEMKAEWQAYARAVGYIMSNGESMVRKIGADAFYRFDPKYRMPSDTVVAAAARVRHSIRRSAR